MIIVSSSRAQRNETSVRRVLFVWAVRSAGEPLVSSALMLFNLIKYILDHVSWIASSLKKALAAHPASLDIDIRVFVTKGSAPSTSTTPLSSSSREKVHHSHGSVDTHEDLGPVDIGSMPYHGTTSRLDGELTSMRGFALHYGRPDMEKLLRDEIGGLPTGSSASVDGTLSLNNSLNSLLTTLVFIISVWARCFGRVSASCIDH